MTQRNETNTSDACASLANPGAKIEGETKVLANSNEWSPTLASMLSHASFPKEPASALVPTGAVLLGVCLDERHPTLIGRVHAHWQVDLQTHDAWLATLHNLAVRQGDHLLLTQPMNGTEPIVIGVIDGFAHRAKMATRAAAHLELKSDETLHIADSRGRGMFDLQASERGPVIKLLQSNVGVEVDGKLSFAADEITMHARHGGVAIVASDDVHVRGEIINLN